MNFKQFARWIRASDDVIAVRRVYIDMVEDLVSGVLLSQIVYWHTPDEYGRPRLSIKHEDSLWLAKSREDWWRECRLTAKQVDRALGILRDRGIIETRLFRFNGSPTIHIRIIEETFMEALNENLYIPEDASEGKMDFNQRGKTNLTKGEDGSPPSGKVHLSKKSKTFIGTETTSENTQRGTTFDKSKTDKPKYPPEVYAKVLASQKPAYRETVQVDPRGVEKYLETYHSDELIEAAKVLS